jgi:hypothetical protein
MHTIGSIIGRAAVGLTESRALASSSTDATASASLSPARAAWSRGWREAFPLCFGGEAMRVSTVLECCVAFRGWMLLLLLLLLG